MIGRVLLKSARAIKVKTRPVQGVGTVLIQIDPSPPCSGLMDPNGEFIEISRNHLFLNPLEETQATRKLTFIRPMLDILYYISIYLYLPLSLSIYIYIFILYLHYFLEP